PQRRIKYPSSVALLPNHWCATLCQLIYDALSIIDRRQIMKYSDQFSHQPINHCQGTSSVHRIWVHVSPNMANATIIADFVQGREQTRNQNLKTSRQARLLF